jgi:large subunit ribosomal protein L4
MEAPLYNQSGEQIGTVQLNEYIFGITPNVPVMHQAMVRQQANARMGTHNTRGRGEVAGSTRKLYRQKGTGRARQGSIRAPHRKGGGVAHGPHPRSYRKDMPRKMRRLAVRSALSAKFAANEIKFIDNVAFDKPRTKDMIAFLAALNAEGKTLLVLSQQDENVKRSASNLPNVKTLLANYLNVIDLLRYNNVLMAQSAIDVVNGYLGANLSSVSVVDEEDAPSTGTTTDLSEEE